MGSGTWFQRHFRRSSMSGDVQVEFVDTRDGSSLGVVEMPPEKLPDSFAVDTTVDVADKKWSVVRAEPVTKVEFAASRQLRLLLSPVVPMPPGELLYSLPTISAELGAGEGSAPPDEEVFQIHEDDWRQVEFVSRTFEREINSELADIRAVYEDRKPGGAFVRVHIRERVPSPLTDKQIRIAELERLLPPRRTYKAVGVQRSLGTFQGSFAWTVDELFTLWGLKDASNLVQVLCVTLSGDSDGSEEWSRVFARLCSDHGLFLVDWCRVRKASEVGEIRSILAS